MNEEQIKTLARETTLRVVEAFGYSPGGRGSIIVAIGEPIIADTICTVLEESEAEVRQVKSALDKLVFKFDERVRELAVAREALEKIAEEEPNDCYAIAREALAKMKELHEDQHQVRPS